MKLKDFLELWLDNNSSFTLMVFRRANCEIRVRYYDRLNEVNSVLLDYEVIGFQFLYGNLIVDIAVEADTLDARKSKEDLISLADVLYRK